MRRQKKRGPKKSHKKTGGKFSIPRGVWIAGSGMLAVCACLVLSFVLLRLAGKNELEKSTVGSVAEMTMGEGSRTDRRHGSTDRLRAGTEAGAADERKRAEAGTKEETKVQEQKEGRVYYRGKAYDFNRDIMTFLVMGIDQKTEKVTEYREGFEAGSADAIFLLVLNPHRKKIQVLAIDRNTMAEVDIYDYYGRYEETIETQICVQHGFGDGTVKSAGYMEKAVSKLMYGLPVNGYFAVNMGAIPKINDSIGGVEVEVLEDLTEADRLLVKGKRVHLMGKSAFWYVKYRDTDRFGSAAGRLERQKQYVTAFLRKAKQEFRKDPSLSVRLFSELKEYMTTDITLGKAVYLADVASGFAFGEEDVWKIPGETVMGEEYEEFYTDENALYEIMLDVFYEEAEDG